MCTLLLKSGNNFINEPYDSPTEIKNGYYATADRIDNNTVVSDFNGNTLELYGNPPNHKTPSK